jgi:hypothetical protein
LVLAFPKSFEMLFCDPVSNEEEHWKKLTSIFLGSVISVKTSLYYFNIIKELKVIFCLFYHVGVNIHCRDLSSWN